ncbi:MAG: hypothetical protein WC613_06260 [Candidatus Aenigmatarchaeota archaeon]
MTITSISDPIRRGYLIGRVVEKYLTRVTTAYYVGESPLDDLVPLLGRRSAKRSMFVYEIAHDIIEAARGLDSKRVLGMMPADFDIKEVKERVAKDVRCFVESCDLEVDESLQRYLDDLQATPVSISQPISAPL